MNRERYSATPSMMSRPALGFVVALILLPSLQCFAQGVEKRVAISAESSLRSSASQDLSPPVPASAAGAGSDRRTSQGRSRGLDGVASGNKVRGVVRAFETATISAELNARITRLPFRDGDRFNRGDTLVEFDCARLNAEVDAASAAHQAHAIAHQNQVQLNRYKAAGLAAVNQTKFEADKTAAELKSLMARQTTCRIAAPFSGRVVERSANAHEIAQPNQPLLRIVNDGRLEIILMVPSSWVGSLQIGKQFRRTAASPAKRGSRRARSAKPSARSHV